MATKVVTCRQADRQTDMIKLKGTFLQLPVVNITLELQICIFINGILEIFNYG